MPKTPEHRSFQHFFGTLTGAGTFYNPPTLMKGDALYTPESEEFYYTDAIADHAIAQIDESVEMGKPFFQYVAFTTMIFGFFVVPVVGLDEL